MQHNTPLPPNFNAEDLSLYEQVNAKIDTYYMAITAAIEADDMESALLMIWDAAQKLYLMSTSYTSDFLELALVHLNEKLSAKGETAFTYKENTILYYDRVADDNHGLTPVLLETLGQIGLKIVYLMPYTQLNYIPKIKHILKKYNGEIQTFRRNSMIDTYNQISDAILKTAPQWAFFYTMPQDAPGALAFMRYKGSMTRYFVDLTDHAFWLGRNACDYYMEGRRYGASLACLYRGISKDKILEVHDSPEFTMSIPFQGFPFKKEEGDFVIFSGGVPYKTEDEKLTFYNILANIMTTHNNVKFWYAFKNDTKGFKKLQEAFPSRVFNTDLRKDIMPILERVDMYLNTYPMFGGTMMRLAAGAGHPPFTLKFNDEAEGLLKNQDSLGIEFNDPQELFNAVNLYITNEVYRNTMKEIIKNAFYTKEEMIEFVKKALFNPTPYDFKPYDPETRDFRAWHFKSHIKEILK